jgi:hypothetical protein
MSFRILNHGAKALAVIIGSQMILTGCQQSDAQRGRVKNETPFSFKVKLSGALDKTDDLSFLHALDSSGVSVYKPSSLGITIPAVDLSSVDITKVADKQLLLTSLKPRLNYEASDGGKKKISCKNVAMNIGPFANQVTCSISGDEALQQQNDMLSALEYKIPTGLKETEQEAWVAMASACVKGGHKPYGNPSDKVLVGCYCTKSGSQWAFSFYQAYSLSSPQQAVDVFKLDCESNRGNRVVDSLAARCKSLKGTDNSGRGCYVCSNIKDVLIDYDQFFTVADPVKAFENKVRASCSGP